MRVITGSARGHKLHTPEGMNTRPTTDKIKESLFNILAMDLPGCEFLDLFAGSGAIGIEALSRGASRAVFVDQSPVCKKIMEENLKFTKLYEKAEIYHQNTLDTISVLRQKGSQFDIIFMDPPYDAGLLEPALMAVVENNLLKKDGYIVAERATDLPIHTGKGLKIFREKQYKLTTMTFLTLEE